MFKGMVFAALGESSAVSTLAEVPNPRNNWGTIRVRIFGRVL